MTHYAKTVSGYTFKKIKALFFLLLAFQLSHGQDISFSIPKKLSGKTPQFKILGKNNEGVIFYRYGRSNFEVEAFNNNLKSRWAKTLNLKQPATEINKIIIYPSKTLIFYLAQVKGIDFLFGERVNSRFQGNEPAQIIDTVDGGKFDVREMVRVTPSQDQSRIIAYYPLFGANEIESLRLTIMNGDLQVLHKVEIPLNTGAKNLTLRKVVPDNKGNIYILLEDKDRNNRKGFYGEEFVIYKYDYENVLLSKLDFDFQFSVFDKLFLEVDNVNDHVAVAGFYSDKAGAEAFGYFYSVMDAQTGELVASHNEKFSPEVIFEITGRDTAKYTSGFYSFNIKNLVLRFDGGAILVAESKYDTEESYQVPSFTPSVGPSYRTVDVFYYNDIMVLSLNPKGQLDWHTILKKKQVSEDDDGFFSSFSSMISSDKLRFVYNEEIYNKTNVHEYRVGTNGSTDREFLFNAGDKNIMLIPQLGKQISSNEILIPSYRRNFLSLVKFAY